MVETMSPAPGGGGGAAGRSAARTRAASAGGGGGGGGGSGGARILRTPGPIPAMVGGEGGEQEEEFMMTPGAAARAGYHEGAAARAGYHDDNMSEDSVANTPHYPSLSSPSPASSDDTTDTAPRPPSLEEAGGGAASSTAAAAFTTAVINDVAPQMFRIMVAPEGRQLITEVAVGADGCCSPRHMVPCYSIDEGAKCVG